MNNSNILIFFVFIVFFSGTYLFAQSHDGFEDGTTQGWTNGAGATDLHPTG